MYVDQLTKAAKEKSIALNNHFITPGTETGNVGETRNKLINFIHVVNSFSSMHLLDIFKKNDLYYEVGLLHYKVL